VGEGGVAGDKVLEVRAVGGKAYYMERQGCECSFRFRFVLQLPASCVGCGRIDKQAVEMDCFGLSVCGIANVCLGY
jgi:hypothetical protein